MAHEEDTALVEAALAGEPGACAEIRGDTTAGWLESVLMKRGATPTESRDLVADLMADCFGARDGKPPLLESYNGGGPLRGFLSRAGINRLIDLKRRQKFQGSLPDRGIESPPADEFDLLEGDSPSPATDDYLVDLLRDALMHAFARCNPRDLMLMRLVTIHGVRQEDIAARFGWSQSKVSRAINGVMEQIRELTVEEIHRADPWLELEWEDFIALCRSTNDFLVGSKV
jgi:RNA polymerase sigma factor (sigma-70 family)